MKTARKTQVKLLITALTALAVPAIIGGCGVKTMNERKGVITFKGGPLTLVGPTLKVGDKAPEFEATANDLSPVKLSSFKGRVCVITSVPSLDTPVCDLETRRFNQEAQKLGDKVVVLTISMDLPFAQKRWCGAAGVASVQTLSDYHGAQFGQAYGVLIKELHLLARTVFVVDQQGVIRYIQVVNEVTSEPNYDEVLQAARALL